MAVEARRACGFRVIGATYLVSPGAGFPCGRFPLELVPCPLCDHRPPFTRGVQRITPKTILHASPVCSAGDPARCERCPLGKALEAESAGLLWVGARFYTPDTFQAEASSQGVSKRIGVVPKWLEVGRTWLFLAHEQALTKVCPTCQGQLLECEACDNTRLVALPAVFFAFVVQRLERIIPDTMPEAERAQLRAQGLTLVEVPADDPDHQPRGRHDDD